MNKRQTANFCSQLRSLLASGMPLLEALQIIEDLPQNKKCHAQLKDVISKINDGHSLSEAASGLLPAMAIGALSAAERAGDMEGALDRMRRYFTDKADLDEKLIGALIYPAFVMILSFLSIIVLIVFVIPGLKELFNDFGTGLPPITSFVLSLGDLFYRLALIFPFVCGTAGIAWFKIKQKDPAVIEKLIIKTPLIGKLFKQEMVIQGFGTLGSLLNGGAPIVEALNITERSSKSRLFKAVISRSREEIENGGKLSGVFEEKGFFPSDAVQMLKVGERSGQLAEMLVSIADFQAKERETALKRITTLLEPAMTLTVGIIVGFIVLAMFLPLVNMVSSIQ